MSDVIKGYVVTSVTDGNAPHDEKGVGGAFCTVINAVDANAARRAAKAQYAERYGTAAGVKFTVKHHVALDRLAEAAEAVA